MHSRRREEEEEEEESASCESLTAHDGTSSKASQALLAPCFPLVLREHEQSETK
jgi:hypothetical protein